MSAPLKTEAPGVTPALALLPAAPDPTAVREFVELLWGSEPLPGARIMGIALQGERSTCTSASTPSGTADWLCRYAATQNVYTGTAAMRPGLRAGSRGKLEDVRLVAGLMIDLDVIGPGRRKPDLWQSVDECKAFLDTVPLGPTVIIHSGNGLQAWWLFREPVETPTDADRARLTAVSKGWSDVVQALARERGRSVDATWDLTRIARVPGTLNRKYPDGPRPVTVLRCEPQRRYTVADFDQFAAAPQSPPPSPPKAAIVGKRLKLDPKAEPPSEKRAALEDADPKFKATLNRKRPDLPDQSPSGYDMALASLAVRAGWTDQEVVNLLIAHRRRHGHDLKLRENYYQRTLDRAREGVAAEDLQNEIVTCGVTPDAEGRAKVLDLFSHVMGAPLIRVVQYMPEGKDLSFHFEDGRTFPISHPDLMRWGSTWAALSRARFAPRTARPRAEVWLGLVNSLIGIAEPVGVEGGGVAAQVARWCLDLAGYFNVGDEADTPTEGRARAMRQNGAFMRAGKLWVRLDGIVRLAREEHAKVTRGEIRHALADLLHAEHRRFTAVASPALSNRVDPLQVTRPCWGATRSELQAAASGGCDAPEGACEPADSAPYTREKFSSGN